MADTQTWLTGAALLVSAMTPVLLALIARMQQRQHAENKEGIKVAAEKVELVRTDLQHAATEQSDKIQVAVEKVEAVRADIKETGATQTGEIKAIHAAVNSEREAMKAELAAIKRELVAALQDKAMLQADASAMARNRRSTDATPDKET